MVMTADEITDHVESVLDALQQVALCITFASPALDDVGFAGIANMAKTTGRALCSGCLMIRSDRLHAIARDAPEG